MLATVTLAHVLRVKAARWQGPVPTEVKMMEDANNTFLKIKIESFLPSCV